MLAPRPRRPASRASIATTLIDSSPPSSWSAEMPRSRATSMTEWSDQGTEMPPQMGGSATEYEEEYGISTKGSYRLQREHAEQDQTPLIDFEDDTPKQKPLMEGTKPADRLKMLLRQMEMEVIDSTPVLPRTMRKEIKEEVRSGWRGGRRLGLAVESAYGDEVPSSPGRVLEHEEDGDDEVESPPTPPLRLQNPYLARQNGRTAPNSPLKDHRLPSRAAVLRNSTSSQSRSTPSPPTPPSSLPARSPLETFIATHPAPPHYPSPSDPSSSRSYDRSHNRSSSSSSSRKGKERASFVDEAQHTPGPARHTRFSRVMHSPPSRSAPTPRRRSVEQAPDDSALFAQEAASLEVQGEVELDLEEISGDIPWDPDIEESRMEEQPPMDEPTARNSTREYSRFSRVLSRPTPSPPPRHAAEETSLPALPEPSYGSSEEEEKPNTLSSRQASLFRSPSKSVSRGDVTSRERSSIRETVSSQNTTEYRDAKSDISKSRETSRRTVSPNQSRSARFDITPDPVRVSKAHVSTPTRPNASVVAPTPHPPGRWYSPAKGSKPARSSPLAAAREQSLMESEGDISIHRLRVSPRKVPASPRASPRQMEKVMEEDEGNSSFLSRLPGLSRMIAKKITIPQPSSTLRDVKGALAHAAQSSSSARVDVEKTQRQFLEALATAQTVGGGAIAVVRTGWTWGTWAWWVCVELLLVWSVFRVTLDYASSAAHLASSDPFSLAANARAIAVPLPSAISAFILPHRDSANFFDLLNRLELWKRIDELGTLSAPGLAEGARMLGVGDVPT